MRTTRETLTIILGCSLLMTLEAMAQSGEVALPPIPAAGTVAVGEIGPFPTSKDVGAFNAATLLLDKRKKLKLSESQVTALTTLQASLTARNADLVTRYDSLLRDHKATPPTIRAVQASGVISGRVVSVSRGSGSGIPSTTPSGGGPVIITETMRGLWDASQELLVRHNADVADAAALLDASQGDEGMKLLDDQTRDMFKRLPQPPTRK